MSDDTLWKAQQRNWLISELRWLIDKWESESKAEGHFCRDEATDRTARARTGGCAIELRELLDKLR